MHDDETRAVKASKATNEHQDETRDAAFPPRGADWNGSTAWPRTLPTQGAQRSASTPLVQQAPRDHRNWSWLGPVIVGVAAVVAAILVFYFVQGRDAGPTSASSDTVRTSAPQPSGTPSTATSPTASTAAPLPAEGTTTCSGGMGTLQSARAVITGTTMSCQFADLVVGDIGAKVGSNPGITDFTLPNEYSEKMHESYDFVCNRQDGLTRCSADGSHGLIALAVQDSAN